MLPLDQAIKRVKGDSRYKLYIFSDPECPYSKRMENVFTHIDNVTIYTFLFPLPRENKNNEILAKKIWCSSQPNQAWQNHMLNNQSPTSTPNCANPIEKNKALAEKINIRGTPTIFLANGIRISGAMNAKDLKQAMNKNP